MTSCDNPIIKMAKVLRGSRTSKGQAKDEDCLDTHDMQICQLKNDKREYVPVNCDETDSKSLQVVLDLLQVEI